MEKNNSPRESINAAVNKKTPPIKKKYANFCINSTIWWFSLKPKIPQNSKNSRMLNNRKDLRDSKFCCN